MLHNLFQKTIKQTQLIPDEPSATVEQPIEEKPKSHLLRNLLLGTGAVFGGFLLFKKPGKAASTKSQVQSQSQLTLESTMHLTKNFVLSEFLISSEFPELKQYQLSQLELNNVTRVATLLQTLRDQYQTPIFINSGGRPETLKVKEGKYKGLDYIQVLTEKGYSPASFSQHMDFSAADFTVSDKETLVKMFLYIKAAGSISPSPITQSLLYIENGIPNFIHVGVISDINNFSSLKTKFLLAKVTAILTNDNKKKRKTEFFTYSPEKLKELLLSDYLHTVS